VKFAAIRAAGLAGAILLVAVSGASLAQAADRISDHIDASWFRATTLDTIDHYLDSAQTANGFFQTTLDRQWNPDVGHYNTVISQCRQVYIFSLAHRLTGDAKYLPAIQNGANFLLSGFYDNPRSGGYGGWFYMVNPDGSVHNDKKISYGQAHTCYALAEAYSQTGNADYLAGANEAWSVLNNNMMDAYGGYPWETERDFTVSSRGNGLNQMMHIFEAAMTLYEVTAGADMFDEAVRIGDFITQTMYRDQLGHAGKGYIPDVYYDNWTAKTSDDGGYIQLGHNMEMSFLLSRGVQMGMPQAWLTAAENTLNFVLEHGYDTDDALISIADYEGNNKNPSSRKSWWEQCELLRALAHWAAVRGRDDLWPLFDDSLAMVQGHFIDPLYGGWYEDYDGVQKPEKGSIWKAGYHETMLGEEALRLAGATPGDADIDGDVDLDDLFTVRNHFGGAGGWLEGDFDGNGLVELDDLFAVRNHFGETAAEAAVPEPATLVMMAVGAVLALRRGRR